MSRFPVDASPEAPRRHLTGPDRDAALEAARRWHNDMKPYFDALYPEDRPSPFREAERALMGQRWTEDEARQLIELVRIGAAQAEANRGASQQ